MSKHFEESLNTAVFTTKFILENKSPILFVYHYEEDGAWQFSGLENPISDDDYRVISLDEVIQLDNTVLELADLPLGGEAYRLDIKSPWIIK
jgi:hypothetical protein